MYVSTSMARICPIRFVISLFFFSSRRRHTRCLSDWSSDVCSSDLGYELTLASRRLERVQAAAEELGAFAVAADVGNADDCQRSEERRVGKESRSRWTR